MHQRERFEIKGVNPTTGKVAMLCLLAASAQVAREQAEACGLLFVQVRADQAVENHAAAPYRARHQPAYLGGARDFGH